MKYAKSRAFQVIKFATRQFEEMVIFRFAARKYSKSLSDNLSFLALCLGCIVTIVLLGLSKPQKTTNIAAFGDSITEGLYSGSGGYPPQLSMEPDDHIPCPKQRDKAGRSLFSNFTDMGILYC